MNKNEFISNIVEQVGVEARTSVVVEAVFDAIVAALAGGEPVKVAGFGTFECVDRAARTGRNPRTGEEVAIAARRSPALRWSQGAKDRVSKGK